MWSVDIDVKGARRAHPPSRAPAAPPSILGDPRFRYPRFDAARVRTFRCDPPNRSFQANLWLNILIGLFAGFTGGSILVMVNGRLFRRKSFKFALFATAGSYISIFAIIIGAVLAINVYNEMQNHVILADAIRSRIGLVINPVILAYFVMWGLITIFTLFMSNNCKNNTFF